MNESADAEAASLRAEWMLLKGDHGELVEETQRLAGSGNAAALTAHRERLSEHHERVRQLTVALEMFHKAHGPLGL